MAVAFTSTLEALPDETEINIETREADLETGLLADKRVKTPLGHMRSEADGSVTLSTWDEPPEEDHANVYEPYPNNAYPND